PHRLHTRRSRDREVDLHGRAPRTVGPRTAGDLPRGAARPREGTSGDDQGPRAPRRDARRDRRSLPRPDARGVPGDRRPRPGLRPGGQRLAPRREPPGLHHRRGRAPREPEAAPRPRGGDRAPRPPLHGRRDDRGSPLPRSRLEPGPVLRRDDRHEVAEDGDAHARERRRGPRRRHRGPGAVVRGEGPRAGLAPQIAIARRPGEEIYVSPPGRFCPRTSAPRDYEVRLSQTNREGPGRYRRRPRCRTSPPPPTRSALSPTAATSSTSPPST